MASLINRLRFFLLELDYVYVFYLENILLDDSFFMSDVLLPLFEDISLDKSREYKSSSSLTITGPPPYILWNIYQTSLLTPLYSLLI